MLLPPTVIGSEYDEFIKPIFCHFATASLPLRARVARFLEKAAGGQRCVSSSCSILPREWHLHSEPVTAAVPSKASASFLPPLAATPRINPALGVANRPDLAKPQAGSNSQQLGTPTIQKTYKNRPFRIRVRLGPIGNWRVGVIAFDAGPSAMISFAILALAAASE